MTPGRRDGHPAIGAKVEVRGAYFSFVDRAPAASVTDAEGHFDLGPQPVTAIAVVARPATGAGWAHVSIDLREDALVPSPDALVLHLGPCEEAVGTVIDVDGRPIVGAVVEAYRFELGHAYRGLMPSSLAEVVTGRSGDFSICRSPGFRLAVRAEGFVSAVLPDVSSPRGFVVVMVPGLEARGVVVGAGGEVVPGALVSFVAAPQAGMDAGQVSTTPRTVMSDARGRFVVNGLPAGTYAVHASAAGFADSSETFRQVAGNDPSMSVRLRGCRQVSGTVVDAAGNGIADASVFDEKADAKGRFLIDCMTFESRNVVVDGRALDDEIPDGEQDLSGLSITVPAARLRVRVTKGGAPVAGAQVSLAYSETTRVTDAGGQVVFQGWTGKELVRVRRGDLVGTAIARSPTHGESRVDIGLEPMSRVRGRLISRDGAPLGSVAVCLESERHRRWTLADASGRFEIESVEPARYSPRPFCNVTDRPRQPSGFPEVEVAAGQTVDIELRVAGKRDSLVGQLVGPDHQPRIAQVCAGAWPLPTTCTISLRDGRFAIDGLLEGQHDVIFTAVDGTFVVRRLLATGADHEIQIPDLGAIEVSADTPGDCTLWLDPRLGRRGQWPFDDHLVLQRLEPGTYQVQLSCDYGGLSGEASVVVVPGETRKVDVDLADVLASP